MLWPHPVQVVPLYSDGRRDDPIQCRGKDISHGGLGFYMPYDLTTPEILIELPNTICPPSLTIPATLVRAKHCADGWYEVRHSVPSHRSAQSPVVCGNLHLIERSGFSFSVRWSRWRLCQRALIGEPGYISNINIKSFPSLSSSVTIRHTPIGDAPCTAPGRLVFAMPATVRAQADSKSSVAKPILTPGQTLADVSKYVEAKIPNPPTVKDKKEWEAYAAKLRQEVLDRVVYRGEAARWRDAKVQVEWSDAEAGGEGYRIKKLRFEALPGLWIPALLYEPAKLEGKVPATLNVMGHDRGGKEVAYQQIRCINLAKRGMLALNVEWFGMGQLRRATATATAG